MRMHERFQQVTREIIGGAMEVHKAFGPGLLEAAYEACLLHELVSRGFGVERQLRVPVEYRGLKIDCAFRLDLLVEKCVVVEIKAVEALQPIHLAQILTYLRLTGRRVGLLINFNVRVLKDGIKRVLNGDPDFPPRASCSSCLRGNLYGASPSRAGTRVQRSGR